ncbi:hypothetical protein [Streptomyces sp. T21Q-yed]|uniref:hypothetical protein n=1 Tax=Streptomyces sp. T21Q-yed TaxID=3018441 RepID=UPI0023DF8783|nr:hypothetical protein [Streptomyces sp. T21Q-yed]
MIIRGICLAEGTFTAQSLESVIGIRADRIQLTLSFWRSCGLIERAPERATYRPTRIARSLAAAWRQGDVHGCRALGRAIRGQWFARSVKARLLDGPALRTGLVTRIMRLAQVGDEYRLEVEMLIDLMVELGLLQPQPGKKLSWCEDTTPTPNPADGPSRSAAEPDAATQDHADDEEAPAGSPEPEPEPSPEDPEPPEAEEPAPHAAGSAGVPPPRTEVGDSLLALLSRPVQLADLARLSADEVLSMHGHITALAAVAVKLRSRSSPH